MEKYFRGPGYPQKFFDGNRFYFPRFSLSGLEWDYACEEHEQLAVFVVTMQLLANYIYAKEKWR